MKKKNIYDYSSHNLGEHLFENYDWDFARIKIHSNSFEQTCRVKIWLEDDLVKKYECFGNANEAYTNAYYKLIDILKQKVSRINEFLEDIKTEDKYICSECGKEITYEDMFVGDHVDFLCPVCYTKYLEKLEG